MNRSSRREHRDMARAYAASRQPAVTPFGPRPIPQRDVSYTQIVTVRNDGPDDWRQWDIIAIGDPIGDPWLTPNPPDPSKDMSSWIGSPQFAGSRLGDSTFVASSPLIGITQETIARGTTGRVCVRGYTPVWLEKPPSGYTDYNDTAWLHVTKSSDGTRWTTHNGPAGDFRVVRFVQWYPLADTNEVLVLVDMCDVFNRRVVWNQSGIALPPYSICASGQVATCGASSVYLPDAPGDSYDILNFRTKFWASPGWEIPAGKYGLAYAVGPESPVLIRTHSNSSTATYIGPAPGETCLWGYLPGFTSIGPSYYKYNAPTFQCWCNYDRRASFSIKIDGTTGYAWACISNNDNPPTASAVYDGSVLPLIRSTFRCPRLPCISQSDGTTIKQINVQPDQVVEAFLGASGFVLDARFLDDPIGTIRIFALTTSIPQGWRLCNGAYGTPDLRGKFLMSVNTNAGAPSNEASIGQTGGYRYHGPTENQHTGATGTAAPATLVTNTSVKAVDTDNRPPFYVVAYIIRTNS